LQSEVLHCCGNFLIDRLSFFIAAVIDIKLSAPKRTPEAAAAQPCAC
jgi:hypothetical protein